MKKLILLLPLILCNSCASHHSISSLSVIVEKENNTSNIIYNIQVEAVDNDGIDSIMISIPSLAISETYSLQKKKKWTYEREVIINQELANLSFVTVYLVDVKGEEKIKKVSLVESTKITLL